jgi:hypothetical protein
MLPFGHVAFSLLGLHLLRPHAALRARAAVAVGALVPDLIDKPLDWLGVVDGTRTMGHSVWLWMAMLGGAAWLRRGGDTTRGGWLLWTGLGVVGHTICDLTADLETGLLYTGRWFALWMGWPLVPRETAVQTVTPCWMQNGFVAFHEMVLVLLAVVVLGQHRGASRSGVGVPGRGDPSARIA